MPVVFDFSIARPSEKKATLARVVIQTYKNYELTFNGKLIFPDKKPDADIKLLRPESEVFASDSLKGFENVPLTINHPPIQENNNYEPFRGGNVESVKVDGDFVKGMGCGEWHG